MMLALSISIFCIDIALIIILCNAEMIKKQMFNLDKAYSYLVHYDINKHIHSEDLQILVYSSIYNKRTVFEMLKVLDTLSADEILFIYGLLKKAEKYDKTIKVVKKER